MDLIVTNRDRKDIAALTDYTLDLAYGADENNFTLSFPDGPRLTAGCLAYMDGTEYGGVVASVGTRRTRTGTILTYKGPTWHGVLAERVLCPDAGQDYLTVDGDANRVLDDLVERVGLSVLMRAEGTDSGVRVSGYQFERYTDMYTGVRRMLKASGAKLLMGYRDGLVRLWAVRAQDYTDEVDSDRIEFDAERDWRPVNHLIGLGEGELKERARSDWYADRDGSVSQTQTLNGLDEVAAVYDYSNAKREELSDKTRDKLKELQAQGKVTVSVCEGQPFDLGDIITGRDNVTGLTVSAEVSKKIVKVERGVMTVSYEAGRETSAKQDLSGRAESSPGGHSYYAGEGLQLDDYTFRSQVTPAGLDAVRHTAEQAGIVAGDASDLAAKALNAAHEAKGVASGKTRIRYADVAPSGPASDTVPGDLWYRLGDGSSVIGMWVSDGSTWIPKSLSGNKLIAPGSVGSSQLADGAVTPAKMRVRDMSNLWPNQRFEDDGPVFGAASEVAPPVGRARLMGSREHFAPASTSFEVTPGDTIAVEATVKPVRGSLDLHAGLCYTNQSNGNTMDSYTGGARTGATYPGGWERVRWLVRVPAGKSRAVACFEIEQGIGSEPPFGDTQWLVSDLTVRRLDREPATDGQLGHVRPDGTSVTIDADGVISAHSDGGLAKHPVGSVTCNTDGRDPARYLGGIWQQLPSLGAFIYERIK